MALQGRRHHLGRARALTVHQDHDGHMRRDERFRFRTECHSLLLDPAFHAHYGPLAQEQIAHVHGLLEQSSPVVAHVQHQGLQRAGAGKLVDPLADLLRAMRVELAYLEVADIRLDPAPFHAAHGDASAGQLDVLRLA